MATIYTFLSNQRAKTIVIENGWRGGGGSANVAQNLLLVFINVILASAHMHVWSLDDLSLWWAV